MHPDVPAVAHIDEARADAPRNGIGVFAGGYEVCVLGEILFQPLALTFNDAAGQQLAAGCNGAFAAQDDVFTVRPGGVVERAKVQQTAVTFHLGALKAAGNAWQIVLRVGSALQDSPFF